MKDWVGVLHGRSCLVCIPKKELLLFDKVGVVDLEEILHTHRHIRGGKPAIADQLEWLEGQGLIFRIEEAPHEFYLQGGHKTDLDAIVALNQAAGELHGKIFSAPKKGSDGSALENLRRVNLLVEMDWARISLVSRTTAEYLTNTQSVNAVSAEHVPELLYRLQAKLQNTIRPAALSDVAQVVLNALPLPSELTPIEDLIAFKQDPETKHRLLGLRMWMRDLAKAELSPRELEEKLEWLLYEYQSYMNLHGSKTVTGTLETVITTTLEIAENLVKFKWSKVAQALFSVRKRKLLLLESEASARGREVSYVAWTKSGFTGNTE